VVLLAVFHEACGPLVVSVVLTVLCLFPAVLGGVGRSVSPAGRSPALTVRVPGSSPHTRKQQVRLNFMYYNNLGADIPSDPLMEGQILIVVNKPSFMGVSIPVKSLDLSIYATHMLVVWLKECD